MAGKIKSTTGSLEDWSNSKHAPASGELVLKAWHAACNDFNLDELSSVGREAGLGDVMRRGAK